MPTNGHNGTRIIFLFLDGVGLGADDPSVNPLARAHLPVSYTHLTLPTSDLV